jgi:hypothetical protein
VHTAAIGFVRNYGPTFTYSGGVYQIGDDQARSWIVAGSFFGNGKLLRAAS